MLWVGFLVLVFALLALDLGVFHRRSHVVSLREAATWTAVWVSLGVAFTGAVFWIYENHLFDATLGGTPKSPLSPGGEAALEYITGYLLEKSLSIDNIFVIALVFDTFEVAPQYRHRVLFWGILGALVSRAVMIFSGVWLISHFTWVFYVFGAYLLFTGAKLLFAPGAEQDPEQTAFVRFVRRVFPIADGDHGERFTTRQGGTFAFTKLALVLFIVEGTDVIFALDSIPAVLAVTQNSFIVFTSNIFAILGLRSLFFVLQGMMARFAYLKVALAFILMFIGGKMCLHAVVELPNLLSLGIILGAIAVGVLASVLFGERGDRPLSEPP